MEIKYVKTHDDAIAPHRRDDGDLAYDFYCVEDENFRPHPFQFNGANKRRLPLAPGQRHRFHTGICLEFPEDYGMLIWGRSGLGHNHGIAVLGGCIDPGYRGEILITIVNLSNHDHEIFPGDRIAQGFLQRKYDVDFIESEELMETARGSKGFGSSGA